jgi:hypothetical protein
MSGRRSSFDLHRNSPDSRKVIRESRAVVLQRARKCLSNETAIGRWWAELTALHLQPPAYQQSKFASVVLGMLTMEHDIVSEQDSDLLNRFAVLLPVVDDIVDGIIIAGDNSHRIRWLQRCVDIFLLYGDSTIVAQIVQEFPESAFTQCTRELHRFVVELLSNRPCLRQTCLIYVQFCEHVQKMVSGMAQEMTWQHEFTLTGQLPSEEQYMHHAIHSSEFPVILYAMMLVFGVEETLNAPLPHSVVQFIETSGTCVRLINDYCGWRRDKADGKPNVIACRMKAKNGNDQAMEAEILSQSQEALEKAVTLANDFPPAYHKWGTAAVRLLKYLHQLFSSTEPHHLNL